MPSLSLFLSSLISAINILQSKDNGKKEEKESKDGKKKKKVKLFE